MEDKNMTLTDRENRIVDLTRTLVRGRINKLPQGFMTCGFLWGVITIRRAQKNGKIRTFSVKTCFGSFTPENWDDAMKAAEGIPGVRLTHYNMD
jgi:hypothetical protein